MCGIVGYIGTKQAAPILLQGLRRLEYRGYDSTGLAVMNQESGIMNHGELQRRRAVGKVDQLSEKIKNQPISGSIGIAHTRWATHGGVTEANAHPHIAANGKLALVHNGIIENYRELKEHLGDVQFKSETDSEVLAHLIAKQYEKESRIMNDESRNSELLRHAVEKTLKHVHGTYGIVVMHEDHPDELIAARMGSPLVIGIGEHEYHIASDATPLLPFTKNVVYLDDGEVAQIRRNGFDTFTLKDESVKKTVEQIQWNEQQVQKQGHAHFMLKEIYDQVTVFEDAIRGRVDMENGTAVLGGLNMTQEQMRSIKRVIFLACGTSSYASMIGAYAFERLAGIPASVEIASEFRYRDPVIDEQTLIFAVSQSGETADTLGALREAKRKGAYVRGIVNVIGSTIPRETNGGTYIHAGPELAVASTKAFTNTVAVVLLYALQFGRLHRVSIATGKKILRALFEIPKKMQTVLEQSNAVAMLAKKYKDARDFYYLGRGVEYPVALEGSLKLKEVTYIHSEAYPAGELKHGPIALLHKDFPVVVIMPKDQLYEKMYSNVQEIKARGSTVILVATQGDVAVKELSEDVIFVPETIELLQPLLTTIPLQLFAYHMAVLLGRDVDRPRNLAKSVTVE